MTTQQMPNPVELYEAAAKNTRKIIAGVKSNQLKDSTPCAKWNVQDLVDHLAGGTDFAITILKGGQLAGEPKPGSGNLAKYDAGVKNVVATAKTPGVMQKTVNTPIGPMPAAQFMMACFMDQLVHGWDLAKATKQDTKLDARHVLVCYNAFAPHIDKMRDPRVFGPAVKVPDNASAQDKMIAMFGRKP
ncbi:MAG: TIGR03086 family protein [SAR202 cluster bacterium]|nr:TIGR03086 family protein [SAR202 cluster bacterium]